MIDRYILNQKICNKAGKINYFANRNIIPKAPNIIHTYTDSMTLIQDTENTLVIRKLIVVRHAYWLKCNVQFIYFEHCYYT